MRADFRSLLCVLAVVATTAQVFGQAETVPATHPIYAFLKRMEVKGVVERYRDAVLPLGRREVAALLRELNEKRDQLTQAEQSLLDDYRREFMFDLDGTTDGFLSVVDSGEPSFGAALEQELSNREKFLYVMSDSAVTMFVNGLLTIDARRIGGDALGNAHTEFVQFGGRIRGTLLGKIGYTLLGTNAQFWGSRALLFRDPVISQYYTLRVTDTQNFDNSEGSVRYDGGIVSVQLGRERVLWGVGYDQKMVASDNVRVFDFLRANIVYKSLAYTFFHGSLLGRRRTLLFTDPSDTSVTYAEPTVADKYLAAHRIEFSFPHVLDIGFQEMVIYSNRSVDLAYLNPFVVLESAQRSREERDNVLWAFDIQTRFTAGLELNATIVFDDLHFPEFFKPRWYNRYAYQIGMMLTDPLFVDDMTLAIEYMCVKPFVYAHDRSRENTYTSLDALLGPRIGPNADSWFVRVDYVPWWNLSLSARGQWVRHGRNIYDAAGRLVRNVGGDVFQPHRPSDPLDAHFLDGELVRLRSMQMLASYQVVNQFWLEAWLHLDAEERTLSGVRSTNTTGGVSIRVEL